MPVVAPITARQALDFERSQLGVTEYPRGSNDQKYGAWYGMNGVAWCDIFQTYSLNHAGWSTVPHFAKCSAHADWFRKNGAWLRSSGTPPVGSLIFYDWGHGIAHVGMFEGLLSDGRLSALEGNTDEAGGRTGGKVMRQYRSRALIAGFGVITYQSEEDDFDMTDDDMKRLAQHIAEALVGPINNAANNLATSLASHIDKGTDAVVKSNKP